MVETGESEDVVTRVRPHCDLCDGTEAFAELTEIWRVVWYTGTHSLNSYTRAKTGRERDMGITYKT